MPRYIACEKCAQAAIWRRVPSLAASALRDYGGLGKMHFEETQLVIFPERVEFADCIDHPFGRTVPASFCRLGLVAQ
jgi:hypothetical protein